MTSSANAASRRVKPTPDTKFHIDYEWWDREGRELRVYLLSHLSPEQREMFAGQTDSDAEEIDWVDPTTAEVRKIDPLDRALQEASQGEDFVTPIT